MDRGEFVKLAMDVLGDRTEYSDDRIIIRRNYNGLDLEVTRKRMDVLNCPELAASSNPVTMVKNGEIIRHHGEHVYLVEHMWAITGQA